MAKSRDHRRRHPPRAAWCAPPRRRGRGARPRSWAWPVGPVRRPRRPGSRSRRVDLRDRRRQAAPRARRRRSLHLAASVPAPPTAPPPTTSPWPAGCSTPPATPASPTSSCCRAPPSTAPGPTTRCRSPRTPRCAPTPASRSRPSGPRSSGWPPSGATAHPGATAARPAPGPGRRRRRPRLAGAGAAPGARRARDADEPPVQFVDLDDLAAAVDLARAPAARRGVQRGARRVDPRRPGALAHRRAAQGAAARAGRAAALVRWGFRWGLGPTPARAGALHAAPVGGRRRPPAGRRAGRRRVQRGGLRRGPRGRPLGHAQPPSPPGDRPRRWPASAWSRVVGGVASVACSAAAAAVRPRPRLDAGQGRTASAVAVERGISVTCAALVGAHDRDVDPVAGRVRRAAPPAGRPCRRSSLAVERHDHVARPAGRRRPPGCPARPTPRACPPSPASRRSPGVGPRVGALDAEPAVAAPRPSASRSSATLSTTSTGATYQATPRSTAVVDAEHRAPAVDHRAARGRRSSASPVDLDAVERGARRARRSARASPTVAVGRGGARRAAAPRDDGDRPGHQVARRRPGRWGCSRRRPGRGPRGRSPGRCRRRSPGRRRRRAGARRGTAPAATSAALVTTMPSSRTTTPEPAVRARRFDGDAPWAAMRCRPTLGRTGWPGAVAMRGTRSGSSGDPLGDRALDDPLAEAEHGHADAREDRPGGARGDDGAPRPAAPAAPPGVAICGGAGRVAGRRSGDRVGAHLGGMAPEPIVRVRRRTEARVVRFGVVVEGHGAEITGGGTETAPHRGAGVRRPAAVR